MDEGEGADEPFNDTALLECKYDEGTADEGLEILPAVVVRDEE